MLVRKFLARNKTEIMPQPPYLPDLALADAFLFPKLKTPMKGKRLAAIEEIKEKIWRYQKARFGRVSRIGRSAGISLLYLIGK